MVYGLSCKNGETIPDSEEERRRTQIIHAGLSTEVIELSSDEDEVIFVKSLFVGKQYPQPLTSQSWGKTSSRKPRSLRPRNIILSSSEESCNDQGTGNGKENLAKSDHSGDSIVSISPQDHASSRRTTEMRPACGSGSDSDAILILDEPRTARKPRRLTTSVPRQPVRPLESNATEFSILQTPISKIQSGISRSNKKKDLALDFANRQSYAYELFKDLNKVVFNNAIPTDTQLHWNKRLLTTAGRAKWHRSRDGVQTTEIELAEKILDCNERIRNTLSHEMCHLATWIIDKDIKQGHGKLFKIWASKIMKSHPEINISTRHNYEISHPYQWKCQKCAKIYGRFSKSIRPDECVCGVCKEGKLFPLFGDEKTPNTLKISRMAASKSQGSPCATHTVPSLLYDSDSDIEVLTFAMGSATLGNKA